MEPLVGTALPAEKRKARLRGPPSTANNQGYDVDLFARHGLDTIGLDVAPTGVVAANKWLESQPPRNARALVQQGDFFAYKPDELFDLIYDYTFLCALPPAMRKDWARRMAELSKDAPSTRLVTLMYPLNGDPNIGPPFRLTEEEYHELLGDEWEITWERAIPEDEKRKGPPGDEKLAVWKRK